MKKRIHAFIFVLFLFAVLSGCGAAEVVRYEEAPALTDAQNSDAQKTDTQKSDAQASSVLCVYVCGAVEVPGVYELPEGARANDAVNAAGGFAEDAAFEAVNLAAQVHDGERIYIPRGDDPEAALASEAETGGITADGLVNINLATAEELATLPGIGESRALDIISYREQNGGFHSPEELMRVNGIKEGIYQKIKGKIVL